jgi:hypothetical protein
MLTFGWVYDTVAWPDAALPAPLKLGAEGGLVSLLATMQPKQG